MAGQQRQRKHRIQQQVFVRISFHRTAGKLEDTTPREGCTTLHITHVSDRKDRKVADGARKFRGGQLGKTMVSWTRLWRKKGRGKNMRTTTEGKSTNGAKGFHKLRYFPVGGSSRRATATAAGIGGNWRPCLLAERPRAGR
eukprot:EG_transcript_21380